MMKNTPPPELSTSLSWDLRSGNSIDNVTWNNINDNPIVYENIDVALQLPYSAEPFHWHTNLFVAFANDAGEIQEITMKSSMLPIDEAYFEALRLAKQLDVRQSSIEQWYIENQNVPDHQLKRLTANSTNLDDPVISISARATLGEGDAYGWIISIGIVWLSAY